MVGFFIICGEYGLGLKKNPSHDYQTNKQSPTKRNTKQKHGLTFDFYIFIRSASKPSVSNWLKESIGCMMCLKNPALT